MRGKLNTIKNVAWALAIGVTLLALLLGLLFAAFTRYGGEMERPQVQLGVLKSGSTGEAAATAAPGAPVQTATGELITLAETKDAGQGYIDSLTFLCDSATIGLRDYGILSDGLETTQVWGSTAGNIPADSFAEYLIRYQAEGVEITPAEAAAKAQPARLVIVLGADGLDSVDQDTFVEGYVALIRSIQQSSPNTVILVCSISSVTTGYSGVDRVNANTIRTVNEWIKTVCMRTGVYYCDSAYAVNDRAGWLDGDYAAVNGKSLNTAGLQKFLEYLRTHAV